jgi:hypothetical protein
LIIAQQLGRPIDSAVFRPEWINSSAGAVGWETSYLQQPADLEAERLFDYGILAPATTGGESFVRLRTVLAMARNQRQGSYSWNFELGSSRPHTFCYVLFPTGVWKLLTCQDLFVAGVGSPRTAVLPAGVINAASNQGHNKRIALLPQGFSWAATTTTFNQPLPTCVASWASWVGNTPYGRFFPDSR